MNENKNNTRPQRRPRGPGGGGPMAMMPGAKAKDFKGTFRKLLSYIRPYILLLIIVAIFACKLKLQTAYNKASKMQLI